MIDTRHACIIHFLINLENKYFALHMRTWMDCYWGQWDQIGRFLKVLGNKFAYKSSQKHLGLLGYFEKEHFVKTI